MADVHGEINRVLGPHLALMRKDIKSNWPTLDPELTLLHWLCERNNLQPPRGSLQSTGRSLPPVTAPVSYPSGAQTARELKAKSMELPPVQASTTPLLLRATPPPQPPKTKLMLKEMDFDAPHQPALGLRSVHKTKERMAIDSNRVQYRAKQLEFDNKAGAGAVATMRQEARGKFVAKVPLLSTAIITEEDQFWLVGKLRPCNAVAGQDVVTQGDPGDTLYIIEQGVCEVIRGGRYICDIGREDFFGELSVIHRRPRNATVRAKQNSTLLALTQADLFATIAPDKLRRMDTAAFSRFFSNIPAMEALTSKHKHFLTEKMCKTEYPAGSVLSSQNSLVVGSMRRLHIISGGACRWERRVKGEDGRNVEQAMIGAGDFFGLLAMFFGCPLDATIIAHEEPVTTMSIGYDELFQICQEHKAEHEDEEDEDILAIIKRTMMKFLVRKIPQLKDIEDNKLALIIAQSHEVTYKRWQPVYKCGEPSDTVFVLQTGTVCESVGDGMYASFDDKEFRESIEANKAAFTEIHQPGTVFGAEALENSDHTPQNTLAATSDARMLCIPGVVLRSTLKADLWKSEAALDELLQ